MVPRVAGHNRVLSEFVQVRERSGQLAVASCNEIEQNGQVVRLRKLDLVPREQGLEQLFRRLLSMKAHGTSNVQLLTC